MARISTNKSMSKSPIKKAKGVGAPPPFQNEQEEADWLASPAGREQARRSFQKAIRHGKIIVNEELSILEASRLAKSTGKAVIRKKDPPGSSTDSTVLERLLEEARGSITKAVSLRISLADLEAAKRVAKKTGKGYQTVLKEIIHEGLLRAS